MTTWTGEVSLMQAGKSYYRPPVFVSVEASGYVVAVAKAVRIAKRKSGQPRMRVEQVLVKVRKVAASTTEHEPLRLDVPEGRS